jgi:tRNA (mo5U34)-methyltransferase
MMTQDASKPGSNALLARLQEIEWFHSIDFGAGLVTPGLDNTRERLDILQIPRDLTGQTVLDVGAWDGFFSFECQRRNAQRVVAADSFAWNGSGWSTKAGFEFARRTRGSRVEDIDIDVLDLEPSRVGTFDLVLMLGVLYHMRHPLLALEAISSVTGRQLIVETHVDLTFLSRPAAAFYPGHDLLLDPTNWWGPNPQAIAGMLKTCGFTRVEIVTPNSALYRLARMAKRLPQYVKKTARHRALPPERLSQGRVVVHAFR